MAIALSGGYPTDSAAESLDGEQHLPRSAHRLRLGQERIFSLVGPSAAVPPKSGDISEIAWSERMATAADQERAGTAEAAGFDPGLIRESFAHVAASPGPAMEYFYSRLFVRYPEMRSMFPHSMHEHMERMFTALEYIVWNIDSPGPLTKFIGQLGRDHRKFGVKERHYESFLPVLVDTVRHFCGHYWTEKTQAAWDASLGHVTAVMTAAARRDAVKQPAWWIGEIVQHDLRGPDLAVLTIKPDQPLRYAPGQYLAVQVPRWPRVWRNFSIANAPRENGLIDLHVRAVPGGMVSGSLVHRARPGDTLLLGQPRGEMTAPQDPGRDMLCVAGGTGLAPVKAIIEGVIEASRSRRHPRIGLLYGARTEKDLYDLTALRVLESAYPGLMVTPVVSGQPGYDGIRGTLPEVSARYASCAGKDIYVCGPARMVVQTISVLVARAGAGRIRHDPVDAAGQPCGETYSRN
jgi:NAD(P)H-flavin reductase/hemoglobin-like flavoprotein